MSVFKHPRKSVVVFLLHPKTYLDAFCACPFYFYNLTPQRYILFASIEIYNSNKLLLCNMSLLSQYIACSLSPILAIQKPLWSNTNRYRGMKTNHVWWWQWRWHYGLSGLPRTKKRQLCQLCRVEPASLDPLATSLTQLMFLVYGSLRTKTSVCSIYYTHTWLQNRYSSESNANFCPQYSPTSNSCMPRLVKVTWPMIRITQSPITNTSHLSPKDVKDSTYCVTCSRLAFLFLFLSRIWIARNAAERRQLQRWWHCWWCDSRCRCRRLHCHGRRFHEKEKNTSPTRYEPCQHIDKSEPFYCGTMMSLWTFHMYFILLLWF